MTLPEFVTDRIGAEAEQWRAAREVAKGGECVRLDVTDWGSGRLNSYCAAHTYFGNGIEPNPWPCLPETREES